MNLYARIPLHEILAEFTVGEPLLASLTAVGSFTKAVQFRLGVLIHDVRNVARYGLEAPLRHQRVWLNPRDVTTAVPLALPERPSGDVVAGDWDLDVVRLSDVPQIRLCLQRWRDGRSWEECGAYDRVLEGIRRRGRHEGCESLADVVERYRRLDVLFEAVKREARLLSRTELQGRAFREHGGIVIHLGRGGELIFGLSGTHRLAAAQLAGVDLIPARLGAVHPGVLPQWRSKVIAKVARPGSGAALG